MYALPDVSHIQGVRKLPLFQPRFPAYYWLMKALPAAYEKYLAGLNSEDAEALRPIFQQSVADGLHGVSMRGNGSHHVQALIDDRVPFGQIHEGYVWD